MKRSIFFLLAIIALGVACQKVDNIPVESLKNGDNVSATGFTGKWKLTATKISSGGPANWTPVASNENQYAQFNSDGTCNFGTYSKYVVKDTVTVTLSRNDTIQHYRYQFIKQDTLVMSPSGPIICIEECAIKFTRQK